MTLDPVIRLRLSTMMFLEFFVWGAWFVTLGTYLASDLGASGSQIALAFLTQSLGAILAPFIVGLIADRFIAADGTHEWRAIWLIPAGLAVLVTLFFATLFTEKEAPEPAAVQS